ncbi:MAG TPA: transglycosylase domain-containing protein, partial [Burkholderiaceae bacterium]|nr:transglycosylase domain-containing protein [Burkholderiaceae bacterium]
MNFLRWVRAAVARLRWHERMPAPLRTYFKQLRDPTIAGTRRAWLAARGAALAALIAVPVFFVLLAAYVVVLIPFTPSVDAVLKARGERPSVVLATDGTLITTFRRLHREWITLDQVPKHVHDALIATEDHRFYEHRGVDWSRTAAAVAYTLRGDRQGGSTITQQLARNFFSEQIGRAPTATRKIKEMITALKIERRYSKHEILETYFNTVPFLYNAVGLEMAARTYFDKSARQLSVVEGATLVGMLKGTSAYNPVTQPERARERRNVVLAQMVKHGRLTAANYERLRAQPLRVNFERQDQETGPAQHFAEAVRRWLVEFARERGYDLYADGLVVHTTLDARLQRLANQAVARQLEALQAVADVEWGRTSAKLLSPQLASYKQARASVEPFGHFWAKRVETVEAFIRESPEFAKLVDDGMDEADALTQLRADRAFMDALRARKTRLEAGFVATDPRDGKVRAWVGSRDFEVDRFDHVLQARRQPGSTFKPFVYGAALEAGIDPSHEYEDKPVSIRLPDGKVWTPRDMGAPKNGENGGYVTLEDGLVFSRNTITAQVIEEVGPGKVVQFAHRMGVRDSRLDPVVSLALGTSPVTLLEMANAYGTLAALGAYRPPQIIVRVTDRHGNVLADYPPPAEAEVEHVLDPEVAVRLISMMRGVIDRGTGRGIRETHGIRA